MIEYLALALLGTWLLWIIWSRAGRVLNPPKVDLNLQATSNLGDDSGAGNLVGIQPFMVPWDYASQKSFFLKLAGYMGIAKNERWLNEKTIVIFPEYIGTWLVATGEKRAVYQARGLTHAMLTLIASNLFSFLWILLAALGRPRPRDIVKYSLFQLKAAKMASSYQSVFARLAREYGVTIVAGSIVLPKPRIINGKLTVGRGALQDVSMVMRPDGTVHGRLVRKVFPIKEELNFIEAASLSEVPAYETPAGRLGVLICADSWYPEIYGTIKSKKPALMAVPSYLGPDGIWNKLWGGYNGSAQPADVNLNDLGQLTEGEAWRKYALPGRMQGSGASYGMNVFLRGSIWDLGSDGHTLTVNEGKLTETEHTAGASITNCWIAN